MDKGMLRNILSINLIYFTLVRVHEGTEAEMWKTLNNIRFN